MKKSKAKLYSKSLLSNVFKFRVEIIYSEDKELLLSAADKLKLPEHTKNNILTSSGVTFYDTETGLMFMFLNSSSLSTIAHESLHVVTRLCEERGIPIRIENDEVLAYLLEWYMNEILLFFNTNKINHETNYSKT